MSMPSTMTPPPLHANSYDPHVEAQKQIDEAISQLKLQIIYLKVQRNDHAPVMRLHPEILQEIFLFAHSSREQKGKTSLRITWVSHRWREIGQNTSELWSYVDFGHLEWVQAALGRTKNRELSFNITSKDIIGLCFSHLHHTKELVLKLSSYDVDDGGFPHSVPGWLLPAPILVKMDLQNVYIPPHTFSNTCPSLTSLHLSSCVIDWGTIPVTKSLNELYVLSPRTPATLAAMRDIFRLTAQGLERLYLRQIDIPQAHSQLEPGQHRIQFQNLQLLRFEDMAPRVSRLLLDVCLLPRRTDVEMVLSLLDPAILDMFNALVVCRNIGAWSMKYLDVQIDQTSVSVSVVENRTDDGIEEYQLRTQFTVPCTDQACHLAAILPLLPVQPIQAICFNGEPSALARHSKVLEALGKYPGIQQLFIQSKVLKTFEYFLTKQETKLLTIIGKDATQYETLDPQIISKAQRALSFQSLRRHLEIFEYEGVGGRFNSLNAGALRKWLQWRTQFDLQVRQLSVTRLDTPPLRWMRETFDGVVEWFDANDVNEVLKGRSNLKK